MKRNSLRALSVLLACGFGGGCLLPVYHRPAGYSSTYHRQLRAAEGQVTAVVTGRRGEPVPLPYEETSPQPDNGAARDGALLPTAAAMDGSGDVTFDEDAGLAVVPELNGGCTGR